MPCLQPTSFCSTWQLRMSQSDASLPCCCEADSLTHPTTRPPIHPPTSDPATKRTSQLAASLCAAAAAAADAGAAADTQLRLFSVRAPPPTQCIPSALLCSRLHAPPPPPTHPPTHQPHHQRTSVPASSCAAAAAAADADAAADTLLRLISVRGPPPACGCCCCCCWGVAGLIGRTGSKVAPPGDTVTQSRGVRLTVTMELAQSTDSS